MLAFPCNQFGAQEPGSDEEILEFASSKFDVAFPMFAKIDVNGPEASAVYAFLKAGNPDEEGNEDIAWNFTKFLVDRSGQVVERFGPGVTPEDALQATESVMPCFEVVDSRIADWKIRIEDTVADNASCGVYVLGEQEADPKDFDLPALKIRVWKNGEILSEGLGSAVQGNPLTAVAWLANTLGRFGIPFKAGEVIRLVVDLLGI